MLIISVDGLRPDLLLRAKTPYMYELFRGGTRARHIPWIITGPGIRKGVDLTTYAPLVINTEDTFATACKLLNIPLDPRIDGRPVVSVMEAPGELLTLRPE